jgi:hypothetical protein
MSLSFRKIANKIAKMFTQQMTSGFAQPYPSFGGPGGSPGPDSEMSGKWTKYRPEYPGPDTVFVRDSIMDGENMFVITDNGQMDMAEFSNNYMKISEEEYSMDAAGNTKQTGTSSPIPQQPTIQKPAIDYDLLTQGLGQEPKEQQSSLTITTKDLEPTIDSVISSQNDEHAIKMPSKVQDNPTYNTIDKVFSKLDNSITAKFDVEWANEFPKQEITMLQKYFDVELKDIANYLVKKYLNVEQLTETVQKYLKKEL